MRFLLICLITVCFAAKKGRRKGNDEKGFMRMARSKKFADEGADRYYDQPERAIKMQLFGNTSLGKYDMTSRPVLAVNTTVNVIIGISLFHILETHEKSQTITTLLSVRMMWRDEYLKWEKEDADNITRIWMPANHLWTPDIVINNQADQELFGERGLITNAIIRYDGLVLWMYPTVVKTYCTLNVQHFPFDSQECKIKFLSWTYDGSRLDLIKQPAMNYYNQSHHEWSVEKITGTKSVRTYNCCVEPFPDITYTIHMKRRSTFYVFNLIAPCLLFYLIAFTGFYLPVESGEKVNLQTTILLAMIVFLMVIGETLPPTPDAIPLLGMFYGVTMLMLSVSLIMSILVTNIYFRRDGNHRPPPFVRKMCIFNCKKFRLTKPCDDIFRGHYMDGTKQDMNNTPQHKLLDIDLIEMQNQHNSSHSPEIDRTSAVFSNNWEAEVNLIRHEWMIVAKNVDRLFFWSFFISSIIALAAIFRKELALSDS